MTPEATTSTIFSKPLKDVTWEDVEEFCNQQHVEGINLDYKQQLTKEIAKTIAAMANTNGGWIIVGVVDEHDKPKLPVTGLDHDPGLESRLTDILISNLWPYFRPLTHLCPPNSDDKTFLLIYVPESLAAPHWVFNRSRLYIRRSDKTATGDWEEQANADIWEMLRNKREKSIKLRRNSVRELEYLFYLHYVDNRQNSLVWADASWETQATKNKLNIYVQPMFPTDKITNPERAGGLFQECGRVYTGDLFPHVDVPIAYYADGAYLYSKEDGLAEEFLGLDIWGSVVYKCDILQEATNENHDLYIQVYELIGRIWKALTFSADAYEKLGYVGLLRLEVVLDLPPGVLMRLATGTTRSGRQNVQGYVSWEGDVEDRQLYDLDARQELMKLILKRIYLAFNAPSVGDEQLTHVLSDTQALSAQLNS